jgi:hypothetical protein
MVLDPTKFRSGHVVALVDGCKYTPQDSGSCGLQRRYFVGGCGQGTGQKMLMALGKLGPAFPLVESR